MKWSNDGAFGIWRRIFSQTQKPYSDGTKITVLPARFRLGRRVSVGLCRRLLGLMAAASPVLLLGLLHMRPFLWWMKSLGIHPSWPSLWVSGACLHALLMWRYPNFLRRGVKMGVVCRRQIIMTDASLSGWGSVFEGRLACGVWSGKYLAWHINSLELRAVHLALIHFLPFLMHSRVIVRTDYNGGGVSHQSLGGDSL